jgi:hypothetical protein
MQDEILGQLVESEGNLCGSFVTANGETVELTILLDGQAPDAALASARALMLTFPETIKRVRSALVEAFLSMVNGDYLDGLAPLDESEFLRRATLAELSIYPEGTADFTFHDDDMLWGHWMTVTRDTKDGLRASMWG